MWYVEVLKKTCNEGDRAFYNAINFDKLLKPQQCPVKKLQ